MKNVKSSAISFLMGIFAICFVLLILVVYLAFSFPGNIFLILLAIILFLGLLVIAMRIALKFMNKNVCPSCHRSIARNTDFCPFCGIQIKPSSMQNLSHPSDTSLIPPSISHMQTIPIPVIRDKCPYCSEKISMGERFCGHCGLPLTS